MNIILLIAVIAGLSVYFTTHALWSFATIVIIVLLSVVAAFYIWLWFYLREKRK
jgi:membrane protein YdbS with pleckstrin-like domain